MSPYHLFVAYPAKYIQFNSDHQWSTLNIRRERFIANITQFNLKVNLYEEEKNGNRSNDLWCTRVNMYQYYFLDSNCKRAQTISENV